MRFARAYTLVFAQAGGKKADLSKRRGDYGVDAPYVPAALGGGALVLFAVALVNASVYPALGGLWLLFSAASYLYTTRRGKFFVWGRLLEDCDLLGSERVLDLGCGRGAVLLLAAKLVPGGRAVGVDLWKSKDQSGNTLETTRRSKASRAAWNW